MTFTMLTRLTPLLAAGAMMLAGGCANKPPARPQAQNTRPTDGWSSKEESTYAAMPERPEVDLGPAFSVMVTVVPGS